MDEIRNIKQMSDEELVVSYIMEKNRLMEWSLREKLTIILAPDFLQEIYFVLHERDLYKIATKIYKILYGYKDAKQIIWFDIDRKFNRSQYE
jgi:hypothetical protein